MIKIGTRSSKLALYQSNLVKDKLSNIYPELDFLLIQIKTKGDKIQDRNLDRNLDKGFFVKEIQEQLLKNEIDIAVHSLKDLPVENNPEIITSAILKRGNHKDVFISNKKKKLSEFTSDNKIGTSSLRRKAQLLSMNPKLKVEDIRGNVDTRISKMSKGDFDGLVMAAAGIERLGLESYITAYLDSDEMLCAPGQGAISVETKKGRSEIHNMVSNINHDDTNKCTFYERSFMNELGGGCNSPIGAFSNISDNKKKITGTVLSLDGKTVFRDSVETDIEDDVNIGLLLANKILESGAQTVIKDISIG